MNELMTKGFSFTQRDWVLATNADFLTPISSHAVDVRYFKLGILLDQILLV